ncbi:GLPGLI family protein [Mucilaginibacter calamicampi]|uniref:GLPGLI family protein n=1 Tax=Mucilaginibacter calamicampi TaxID=1302352 RepID=A0ABW2YUN8_9SPHI
MKKTIITLITILITGTTLFAQQSVRFVTSGTIEYQKRVNTFQVMGNVVAPSADANIKARITQVVDQYKKTQSQFATFNSSLSFSGNKTLLTPILPVTPYQSFQLNPITAESNTIYTDLAASKIVMEKDAMGEQFLLSDSTRKVKWRITNETRDILGYNCIRANGIISDSIYVVAFYADKIRVSGGPELFTGLPGMILQLAIPHENVSWVATKIVDSEPAKAIAPPKKGKPVTTQQLIATIKKGMDAYRVSGINVDYYLKILGLL